MGENGRVCYITPNTDGDKIIRRLDQYGIGVHVGTSVPVFPASYHSEGDKDITDTEDSSVESVISASKAKDEAEEGML